MTTGDDNKLGIHRGISKGANDFPHGTRIQIEVDNIEESIEISVELGAEIVRDKMEFDNFYLAYSRSRRHLIKSYLRRVAALLGLLRVFR